MIVKVCGITNTDQFKWLNEHGIDFIGLNFYPKSKRYVKALNLNVLNAISKRVGVFVNPSRSELHAKCKEFNLDMVQLHGNESAAFCSQVSQDIPIIKAFGIDDSFNFKELEPYLESVAYFLFDTKSKNYGGSGKKFNWQKLKQYDYNTPFFLSGGITLEDISIILALNFELLVGIDVNSGFEDSPGVKNLCKIDKMMKLIKNEKSKQ